MQNKQPLKIFIAFSNEDREVRDKLLAQMNVLKMKEHWEIWASHEIKAVTTTYSDSARKRLEEVIQTGYPNAEISKTKEGKSAVIAFRSNDKDTAIRIADKLTEKGMDAAVFDRTN